jgi:beta-lactam-binding protein with PASTA domain
MKRVFAIVFGTGAMILVAGLAAFVSLRLAIHGREVRVPSLAGLADPDAAAAAKKLGLNLSVENRFYSAGVAPNHVLSQSPASGSLVRRGGEVRVTESLGGQDVSIPDVTGQTQRPAELMLRRLQLDLGTTAHIPAPGESGVVLTQSPPPNTQGVFGPHVSILVSDPQADAPPQAYIMPSLVGLTVTAAAVRLSSAGLHIASTQDPSAIPPATVLPSDPAIPPDVNPTPPPVSPSSLIASQSPPPGHRVTRNDAIRVTIAHANPTPDQSTPPTP